MRNLFHIHSKNNVNLFIITANTIMLLIAFIIITSCTNKNKDTKNKSEQNQTFVYSSLDDKVKEAKNILNRITCDALKIKLASNNGVYLIDVREPNEYLDGHIEKSFSIPRGIIEFNIEKALPQVKKTDEIILYSYRDDRAVLAGSSLISLGYKNVWYLSGGYSAFIKPIAKSSSTTTSKNNSNEEYDTIDTIKIESKK